MSDARSALRTVGESSFGRDLAARVRPRASLHQPMSSGRFIGAVGRASLGFGRAVGRSQTSRPIVETSNLNTNMLRPPTGWWHRNSNQPANLATEPFIVQRASAASRPTPSWTDRLLDPTTPSQLNRTAPPAPAPTQATKSALRSAPSVDRFEALRDMLAAGLTPDGRGVSAEVATAAAQSGGQADRTLDALNRPASGDTTIGASPTMGGRDRVALRRTFGTTVRGGTTAGPRTGPGQLGQRVQPEKIDANAPRPAHTRSGQIGRSAPPATPGARPTLADPSAGAPTARTDRASRTRPTAQPNARLDALRGMLEDRGETPVAPDGSRSATDRSPNPAPRVNTRTTTTTDPPPTRTDPSATPTRPLRSASAPGAPQPTSTPPPGPPAPRRTVDGTLPSTDPQRTADRPTLHDGSGGPAAPTLHSDPQPTGDLRLQRMISERGQPSIAYQAAQRATRRAAAPNEHAAGPIARLAPVLAPHPTDRARAAGDARAITTLPRVRPALPGSHDPGQVIRRVTLPRSLSHGHRPPASVLAPARSGHTVSVASRSADATRRERSSIDSVAVGHPEQFLDVLVPRASVMTVHDTAVHDIAVHDIDRRIHESVVSAPGSHPSARSHTENPWQRGEHAVAHTVGRRSEPGRTEDPFTSGLRRRPTGPSTAPGSVLRDVLRRQMNQPLLDLPAPAPRAESTVESVGEPTNTSPLARRFQTALDAVGPTTTRDTPSAARPATPVERSMPAATSLRSPANRPTSAPTHAPTNAPTMRDHQAVVSEPDHRSAAVIARGLAAEPRIARQQREIARSVAPPTAPAHSRPLDDVDVRRDPADAIPGTAAIRHEPTTRAAIVADRFMTELSRSARSRPTPLPAAFSAMATEIAGRRSVMLSTDTASRRALRKVGKVAATTGNTIHLDQASTPTSRMNEVVAHELTHIANPSPAPRFFDDIDDSPEERRAESVAKTMSRSRLAPSSSVLTPSTGPQQLRRTPAASPVPGSTAHDGSGGTVSAAALAANIDHGGSSVGHGSIQRWATGSRPARSGASQSGPMIGSTRSPAPSAPTSAASPTSTPAPSPSPAPTSAGQPADSAISAWIKSDAANEWFTRQLERNLDEILRRVEDQMIIELERRGGREWGAL